MIKQILRRLGYVTFKEMDETIDFCSQLIKCENNQRLRRVHNIIYEYMHLNKPNRDSLGKYTKKQNPAKLCIEYENKYGPIRGR